MERVYICELCRKAYKPKPISQGCRLLQHFRDYVVDLDLLQFRKLVYNKTVEFIDFTSPKGKKLLAQMHEQVTR